jgi:prevent-host-death family protein
MKKRVSIYEAKAKLTGLVREVQQTGEGVTVTKHGTPAVDIVPHQEKKASLKPHPS